MKGIFKITAFALVIVLSSSLQNKASAQYSDDVSYQTFYDDLSPHGRWIDYPDYGYVWSPNEGQDFRPYSSNGHWVFSDDYEWMWVSDYKWGWAPFHYGRWFNDPYYGWLWVPGYEWAPAWVAWRSGGDYYGWAPLRPGINISIHFSLGDYYAPDDYWCFSPRRYITSPRLYDYCIDRRQNINFIHNTIIIGNFNRNGNVFVTGPRRGEVESYCGRINPVQFRYSSRPGRPEFRNNEVAIYRPNIQMDDNRRFSPRNFDRYDRQSQNVDHRTGRNDNRPGRNDDNFRRDDIVNNRGNNLPGRRESNDNGMRQLQDNNGGNDLRRRNIFNHNKDDIRQPGRNNDEGVPRQVERPNNSTPGNNDNRFNERRNNRDNNRDFRNEDTPIRQPQPQIRNDDNPPRRPFSPLVEQPKRQQQPRNFERRGDGNSERGNGRNNGRAGGRRRG